MKFHSLLAFFVSLAPVLAQIPPYPNVTGTNPAPYPTNPYSPVTITANCTKPVTSTLTLTSDYTSTITNIATFSACTTTTTRRRRGSTTTTTTTVTSTTSIPASSCPSSTSTGPLINVLGYRTSTCAVPDAGDGFLVELEDVKLALVPGTRRSNCGQFGGYIGSVSFLADGPTPPDGCELRFYGATNCGGVAAAVLGMAEQVGRCVYLASFDFQPGSLRMYC